MEIPVNSSTPLRIAVVGVGGIGSTFAFQLSVNGGHDVTVVARPGSPRLRQLQTTNGIVNVKDQRAEVRVIDTFDEKNAYDLVIVTLLAHQVDSVLPALKRSSAKCILFMFNNFDSERLKDTVGADRCAFGMPFVQGHIDKDGKLNAVIGAAGQKSKLSQERWVNIFRSAGIPAVLESDMVLWLRCHVPLCVAFESVSVAGVRRGGGASWSEALVIARGVREGFKLIRGLGYEIYPRGKAWLGGSPAWVVASLLWSMSRITSFRELLATGIGECRALVDTMIAEADRSKIRVDLAKLTAMKPSE